jgi:hypothetical protein
MFGFSRLPGVILLLDSTEIVSDAEPSLSVATGLISSMLLILFLFVIISTLEFGQDATPFTMEEWKFAFQDGYAFNMLEHYFRHGGL